MTKFSILFAAFFASAAQAADPVLMDAVKIGEKRQYDQALFKLNELLPTLADPDKSSGMLAAGLLSMRAADLYNAFNGLNVKTLSDAYDLLEKEKKDLRSKYVEFYRAELLVQSDRCKDAAPLLKKVAESKSVDADHKAFASIRQAECLLRAGSKANGEASLDKVKETSPVVTAEKLAIKARYSQKRDSVIADWKKFAAKNPDMSSVRMVSKAIAVYTSAGEYEQAIALLKKTDLTRPSFEESLKDKMFHYYDVSLLPNMAELFKASAKNYFEKLKDHAKLAGQSKYYSAQLSLVGVDAVSQFPNAALPDDSVVSDKLKPYLAVYRGATSDAKAKVKMSGVKWIAGNEQQLDVVAEGLRVCLKLGQECAELLEFGKKNAGEQFGAKFVSLNRAIGEMLLQKNEVSPAITYLEYARDKSNKNKIEANDPMLLVALANGYRLTKAYSESLEILFEFSKHFPAVRQLQDALQSIYSVEQKSAGDVRIF